MCRSSAHGQTEDPNPKWEESPSAPRNTTSLGFMPSSRRDAAVHQAHRNRPLCCSPATFRLEDGRELKTASHTQPHLQRNHLSSGQLGTFVSTGRLARAFGVLPRDFFMSLSDRSAQWLSKIPVHTQLRRQYSSPSHTFACRKYFIPTHATMTHTHAMTPVMTMSAG
jgi:hypothetical protein